MRGQHAVNTAVLVSGGGTNLQAILDAEKSGVITHATIKAVISSSTAAYALERAKKAGVKAYAIDKKGLNLSRDEFETCLVALLEKEQIELIVLAGFMTVLSADFCKRYANRIINVHPSLIPKFCGDGFYGLKVHEAVLAAGEKVTGATVHFVTEVTDGGAIIEQKQVAIKDGDTPETLQKRVMQEAEWVIFPQAVESVAKRILDGEI